MKKTSQSANGTSFHDTTICCSVATLKEVLGDPDYDGNDGQDKVNFEWVMETENGDVFTVYDWKEYHSLSENQTVTWHIGGNNAGVTKNAKLEIRKAIHNH